MIDRLLALPLGQHRGPCPECRRGKSDEALSVNCDARGVRWCCHRCNLKGHADRPAGARPRVRDAAERDAADVRAKQRRAQRLYDRAIPLCGAVEKYLAERRVLDRLPEGHPLRAEPRCWNFGAKAYLPALVAPMTDAGSGAFRGTHLTFVDPSGLMKAAVSPQRMYIGPKRGAVVRLSPDEDVLQSLVIGEGLETVLSHDARPVWACMDSANLAAFLVLAGIRSITVLADNDVSGAGERAALEASRRWREAGREVRCLMPRKPGSDFNDLLLKGKYHRG